MVVSLSVNTTIRTKSACEYEDEMRYFSMEQLKILLVVIMPRP